jgi:hypothetical protein
MEARLARPKSEGDTDYTDLTDFTDDTSGRRAPCTTSRDEHFVNGTPAKPLTPETSRGRSHRIIQARAVAASRARRSDPFNRQNP